MNIDHLLIEIERRGFENLPSTVPARDLKILKSLFISVTSPLFITKNQSRLLVKILSENKEKLTTVSEFIEKSLAEPMWSKSFRPVEQIKRIFIYKAKDNTPLLAVEFSFNTNFKKILQNLTRVVDGPITFSAGKINLLELTERNIVALIENFKKHKFEISEEVLGFYNTIKSWKFHEISQKFHIEQLQGTSAYTALIDDIGEDGLGNEDLVQDRQVKFQYQGTFSEKTENSVKNTIISRSTPKVWIDSRENKLSDLLTALTDLKRFPILLTWEHNEEKHALEILNTVNEGLKKCEILEGVGVYFRLDNSDIGKEFNRLIAENKYNVILNDETKVACVPNGKIPKFFIKNDWTPKTVISIGTSLRYSKTAVYANCCDLIITYHHSPALMETTRTL
jgi:hypothetical protein